MIRKDIELCKASKEVIGLGQGPPDAKTFQLNGGIISFSIIEGSGSTLDNPHQCLGILGLGLDEGVADAMKPGRICYQFGVKIGIKVMKGQRGHQGCLDAVERKIMDWQPLKLDSFFQQTGDGL